MRKLTGITLIALALAGVAFAVVTPRKGSIPYHKGEYRDAAAEVTHNTLRDRLKRYYCNIRKTAPPLQGERFDAHLKLESSRKALVRLGYLVERRIGLSHRTGKEICRVFVKANGGVDALVQRFVYMAIDPNAVLLIAPREDIGQLEDQIRKADVP